MTHTASRWRVKSTFSLDRLACTTPQQFELTAGKSALMKKWRNIDDKWVNENIYNGQPEMHTIKTDQAKKRVTTLRDHYEIELPRVTAFIRFVEDWDPKRADDAPPHVAADATRQYSVQAEPSSIQSSSMRSKRLVVSTRAVRPQSSTPASVVFYCRKRTFKLIDICVSESDHI